ncbi:TetR/AcrR family transcriptional regulator, partial [Streptococcus suis]
FQLDDELPGQLTFLEYVKHCFQQIQVGMTKYPNFFTIHTISFSNKEDQLKARRSMEAYFQKIRTILITTLEADASIDSSVFSEE